MPPAPAAVTTFTGRTVSGAAAGVPQRHSSSGNKNKAKRINEKLTSESEVNFHTTARRGILTDEYPDNSF